MGQETLNDIRSKPLKSRSKSSSNKNFSNLLDDRKHPAPFPATLTSPKSDCKGHVRPSTLLAARDSQAPIGIGGGGIIGREDDQKEFEESPTTTSLHPLYHLSLNGE